MTKRIYTPLAIATLLVMGLFSPSCTTVDEGYIVRLDSLDLVQTVTTQYLDIDMKVIEKRNELIFDHLRLMNRHYDGADETMGRSLTKYKGIKKAYTRYLGQYEEAIKEQEALKKQAADLRTSVNNREISKAEFKQYYATEMNDSKTNFSTAKYLFEALHSLEPEYQRISRQVSNELLRVSKTNPNLADILGNMAVDTSRLLTP